MPPSVNAESTHRAVMMMVAPGTELRAGLERILAGRTGALIAVGVDPAASPLCDGGFRLDEEFSPTRLRELAKMDGAVLLSADTRRILGANVQLMPDASIPTVESGTRHRTAERVAIQTGHPVIAVSHSMNVISLYQDGKRYEVADSSKILARANQALATVHRYRGQLDEMIHTLTVAEIEDVVTLRDALTVLQRLLMVEQIADELTDDLIELGTDGRLLDLQLAEVLVGTGDLGELLLRDYLPALAHGTDRDDGAATMHHGLGAMRGTDLLDLSLLARTIGYDLQAGSLDDSVSPRGARLLARVPQVPPVMLGRVATHFGSLQAVLAATAADLQSVEGIGEARARTIREGLARLVETALADRRPERW